MFYDMLFFFQTCCLKGEPQREGEIEEEEEEEEASSNWLQGPARHLSRYISGRNTI